jgi:23S rRNA (adenine2503-C2)-methyltransferase
MGCPFCATGLAGLRRNLTSGEIVDQYLLARSLALASGVDIGSIVYMGMGEPLANLDNVKRSVEWLVSGDYCGLGARRITISTIGLRGRIRKLAEWPWQIGLAISLHAPSDEVRRRLVPPSRSFGLGELMADSVYYQRKSGRRVSYEYVMLDAVNDSNDQARALGDLLAGQLCHVNLIPYNSVAGTGYRGATSAATERFRRTLEAGGVPVTVRRPRGRDIAAACGQLAGSGVEVVR